MLNSFTNSVKRYLALGPSYDPTIHNYSGWRSYDLYFLILSNKKDPEFIQKIKNYAIYYDDPATLEFLYGNGLIAINNDDLTSAKQYVSVDIITFINNVSPFIFNNPLNKYFSKENGHYSVVDNKLILSDIFYARPENSYSSHNF